MKMANDSGGGGVTAFLAFLVGGLIVAVAALGFFIYNGHNGTAAYPPSHISLNLRTPPTHQ
jgi:hypothetical protein